VSHKQTYSEAGLAQSRLWPAGTICITIAANIADSAILTYPVCFPDSVVGLIVDPEFCVTEFVEFFVRTAREDLSQFAPATAQKNINIGILGEVAVPLPPLDEQREIVRRVETLFTLANEIEARVRAATMQTERLPQAILGRAFRGELVPTEAQLAADEGREYESASTLLERIRELRKQQQPAQRGRGGKKMTKRVGRQAAKSRRPLAEVLHEHGKPLSAERLFDLAGFDETTVDEFYDELRGLIQEGTVRERRPNEKDVTLETVGA
jgi:type I restriction enzyme S subunit